MEKQKDGTCVTYEGEYDAEMHTGLWWGNPRGRDHLRGRRSRWSGWGVVVLKLFLNRMGRRGWINLAQDRDRWWAFVNTLRNIRDP